jgi:hypothetical protein
MKPSLRIVTLLAALLGCSGEEDPTESLAGELPFYPVPGCESVEHAPCDVRAEACQTQLLAMAACLRGSESVELPPIEMIDKAEYARRLREGLGTAARPDPDHEEAAFVLLRLIPVDGFGTEALVAEAVDFVGGFYDSDTQAITLVDAGSDLTARDWSALMVHEFIHYLQDKQLSLAAWREHYRASEDTWFALRALVEGEAQFHQLRYVASLSDSIRRVCRSTPSSRAGFHRTKSSSCNRTLRIWSLRIAFRTIGAGATSATPGAWQGMRAFTSALPTHRRPRTP